MLNPDVQGMTPEESRIQVLQLYGRMLQAKGISVAEQNPIVATLRLSGVGIEEGGVLRVRNRVYRTIFDERWRQQNLPDSEVRRQRSAARKATVRAASLAAVLVVGLSAATLGALKLSNDRQQAVERLQQQSKVLEYQSYVGLMARLRLAMSEGRWQRVSSLIDSSRSNPLRGWEWGYAALSVTRHVAEPKVEAGRMIIEAVPGGNLTLFTPDTLYKFTPNGLQIEQSLPASNRFPKLRRGNLRVLEEEGTGALYFENALTHQVLGVSRTRHRFFDVDPKTQTFLGVLPGGNDAPFFILSLNGKVIQSFVGSTFPIAGRLLPDGTVLTVHQGGNIRRRDRTGKILASITMNDVEMGGWGKIALSSDGSQFVFLDSRYRRLEVRRCSDLNVVAQISGLRRTSSCSFSPNGQLLALGGTDGVLDVIDVKTGRVVDSLPGHRASISSVEFFDQGRFLASLDNAARIRIWPVGAKGSVQLYPEFEQEQASSAFLVREGKVLITTSSAWSGEPTLSSRNLNTGKLGRLAGWRSYKATDDVLYVTFLNGDVGLVDPDGLTVKARMRVFDEHIGEVFLCDSGKKLLVQRYRGQDAPGRYAILNATTLKVLSRINLDWPAGTRVQDQISVTPSGKLIAIAATVADVETQKRELSGVLHLVSTDDGRIVKRLQTEKPFRTILLEPNGGRILLASFASGAFPTTPTVLTVPELRSARALEESLIFDRMLLSPDGKVLAGFSAIGGVPSLWDYQSGKRIALLSPGVAIQSFTFSPDSLRVITGATNRTTTIWDGKTGEELFSLRYDPLRIDDQNGPAVSDTSVFSADGRQVIMACTDGCVRIFNSIPWKDQPKTAAKNGP
jgi:WD40 repeat protein